MVKRAVTLYHPVRVIEARTVGYDGRAKDWLISGIPAFSPDELVERRLRRRHFVWFGSCAETLTWKWGGPA